MCGDTPVLIPHISAVCDLTSTYLCVNGCLMMKVVGKTQISAGVKSRIEGKGIFSIRPLTLCTETAPTIDMDIITRV